MSNQKMSAGQSFPAMSWEAVGGGARVNPQGASGWRLLVVYRGKHCPLCKAYLKTLGEMKSDFETAQIAVMTLSADPKEKAESEALEEGWDFPVGYGLTPVQMRELGLYISDPRTPQETDRPFAEPAIFAINPDGNVQVIDISNAPFSRPDLASLLKGLKFIQEKQYPIRGTKG